MELIILDIMGILIKTTFRLELLKFIYDGKIILAVFLILTLLLFFLSNRSQIVKLSLILNIVFILTFLIITVAERVIEYPTLLHSDPFSTLQFSHDLVYKHSDKFIGMLVFYSLNLLLIYKKLIFGDPESEQNQEE